MHLSISTCHSFILRFLCVVIVAFGVSILTASAKAQSAALITVELAHSSPPVRSDSPLTFIWRIQSQSTSLIEGRLDVTIRDGAERLAHAEIDEVVLTTGDQLFRTILPPVDSNNSLNAIEVDVAFISKSQKFGPWQFSLRSPSQWQRSLTILISDPWQTRLTTDKQQLVDRLRIETCNADSADRTLSTFPAHVRPEDLSVDSLGYCGFDLVLLAREGFSEVKDGQLRGLLDWVQAGGSLCVIPEDGRLNDYHAQFLNQALHLSSEKPQFSLDSTGRMMSFEESPTGQSSVTLRRHGLGRFAIVSGKLDRLLAENESDVRRMVAFLWKVRRDRLDEFLTTGKFLVRSDVLIDKPDPNDNLWQAQQSRNVSYAALRPKEMQLAPLPLQSGDQLLARLMPKGLQVVPMSLIGLILIVYVLLIGPTDWLVLGAIKRRKWTWISFPVVTISLTLATVWLAEWYMSVSDNHRMVAFHDVGEDGKIARRNRFEVLFQGSERMITSEVSREFLTAMTHQRFSSGLWQSYQQAQLRGKNQSLVYTPVANYAGRVPASFKVTQFVAQWTPQLNRRFAIPSGKDSPVEFDWSKFADRKVYHPESVTIGQARDVLVQSIRQAFGDTAGIAVIAGGKWHNLAGQPSLSPTVAAPFGFDPYGNPIAQPAPYQNVANVNLAPPSFIEDVSLNAQGGLFAFVSQKSPTGGKDFEDMVLVDPSDAEEWLLVIEVDRGSELVVYRKLYSRGD